MGIQLNQRQIIIEGNILTNSIAKFKRLYTLSKIIKNWYDIIFFYIKFKKTPNIKFKTGETKYFTKKEEFKKFWSTNEGIIKSYKAFFYISKNYNLKIKKNIIKFDYNNKEVKFFYDSKFQLANSLQLLYLQFIQGHNNWLEVNQKNVLDIGANIGDTSIFFALNNAKHVFAIEPYPYSCRIIKRNIKLNKMEEKISIINAAIGTKSSFMKIKYNYKNLNSDIIKKDENGVRIPIYSLDQIIEKLNLHNIAMKMDCEGYEYGIIKTASLYSLKKIKNLIISCHNVKQSYNEIKILKNKLIFSGFIIVNKLPDNSIGAYKK